MKNVGIRDIPIGHIRPNPNQPRKFFDEAKLGVLAESIKRIGLIQPILVRPKKGFYELVHGERRWRATRIAGLETIRAEVKELPDDQALEVSLTENLQREDINPIEEATGYQALIEKFGYTQEMVADKIGKSRPYVANSIRLLKLDPFLKACVLCKTISVWHARVMMALPPDILPYRVADLVMDYDLSVAEVRKIIDDIKKGFPVISWDRDVPIEALEKAGGIIDGYHRLRIAHALGWKTVPTRQLFYVEWLKKSPNAKISRKTSVGTPKITEIDENEYKLLPERSAEFFKNLKQLPRTLRDLGVDPNDYPILKRGQTDAKSTKVGGPG